MNHNFDICPITLNTTRICTNNSIDTAVGVSRISFTNMKPNAVILVNKNEVFDGIAAASLVHFPIDAPILFSDGMRLNRETSAEINRLSPKGYKGVQIILVGNLSKNIDLELNSLGYKTRHITGSNHYETACRIPNERNNFKNVLIVSGEDYTEGIFAAFWSAHHGDPILLVQKNSIPACTLNAIKKMRNINVYIIGSTNTVSKTVEASLSELTNVKSLNRITGENPYDIAVNFSKYKDPKTEFGWGRNYREGHAFTFAALNHPMDIIAAVVFAHMGKHTPLLLTRNSFVPPEVARYIKAVKPLPSKDMPRPPFMHGFILGDTSYITYQAQLTTEELLSIDHEMTNMTHENPIRLMSPIYPWTK